MPRVRGGGSRPSGPDTASSGSRPALSAGESLGEGYSRLPLGVGSVLRAAEPRDGGPAGTRRGGVHQQGVAVGDEAQEHEQWKKQAKGDQKGDREKGGKKGKEKGKGKGTPKEKPKEASAMTKWVHGHCRGGGG